MAAKPQSGDEETQTTHCQPRAVLAFGMVIDPGGYLSWPRRRFAAEVLDLACLDRAAWGLLGRLGACPSPSKNAHSHTREQVTRTDMDVGVLAGLDFNLVAALGGDFWTWFGAAEGPLWPRRNVSPHS